MRYFDSFCICCIGVCFAFCLSCFPLSLDISILSFLLCLLFCIPFFLFFKKFYKKNDYALFPILHKFLEYAPFVCLICFVIRRAGNYDVIFFLDCVQVGEWCVVCISSILALHIISPKKIQKNIQGFAKWQEQNPSKKPKGFKKIGYEAASWVDALVQAIFMVMLVNIFILQLYEIPSESMVPEFLIKDRVVVFKTFCAPKFPLSKIGLPELAKYERGDIVVFRNPHYAMDRKSEVKTVLSQLVYMCSLTTVNLNRDAQGNPKADPLVKRICGIEGEQLVMQDGILYSRTKQEPNWKKVQEDDAWATWDLSQTKPEIEKKIRDFPLSKQDYQDMLETEKQRNLLDVEQAKQECQRIADEFSSLFPVSKQVAIQKDKIQGFSKNDLFVFNLFAKAQSNITKIISNDEAKMWFHYFLTDWKQKDIEQKNGFFAGDIYQDACYRLDIMTKLCAGRLYLKMAKLAKQNVPFEKWGEDKEILLLMQEADKLNNYFFLQDRRNFGIFPANDGKTGEACYIPKGNFFMMGDNRFNSLDMRHSYDEWLSPITQFDDYSVQYLCNLSPQYVPQSKILGKTTYRFWPLSRKGVPGHTGK